MQFRYALLRRIVLASLALMLLGVGISSNFAFHTSQAAGSSGPLYSWGYNHYGQLGNGTTTNNPTPKVVILPNGVTPTNVGGGQYFSFATGSDGKLYAWGDNTVGQLGNGTTTQNNTPVIVNLPAGVTPLAVGGGQEHSMAIGNDGKLYAWGYNGDGQLGNGTTTDNYTPGVVHLPAGVTPITMSVGYNQNAVIGSDNKLYMWGYGAYGQLGLGGTSDVYTPTVVTLAAGVTPVAVSTKGFHTMAIGSDGKLYTWGRNDSGQLGNGTTGQTNTPGVITLASGVSPIAVYASYYHSVAIGSDNHVYTWGHNDLGQIGNGTSTDSSVPVMITLPGGATPVSIAAGIYHTMAFASDGKLYAWGVNSEGELGTGITTGQKLTPQVVSLPAGATLNSFAVGGDHTLAILSIPTININNVSQAEGNSGTTNFNFTVSLSYATSQTVTVNYATSNGTATAPADYTAASGTLTFAPGTITQTVAVPVNGDTTIEPDETFTVTLSGPNSAATLGTATGTGTLLNDDDATTLVSSPNPSLVGQSVTFTATVSSVTATGTVTFTEGASTLGTATLSSGVAVFNTSSLPAGSHSIVANYGGNSLFSPSTSPVVTQVVNLNTSSLSLASSPNPSAVGQIVTFTATVSPTAASGTVTFTEGATVLGTASLASGKAIYTTSSLSLGSHVISATYDGNSTYAGSSSTTVTQVVNLNNTTLALTSNPNPSLVGQSVTFTATVSPAAASGTVTFTEGATVIGTASLASGKAVYTTSSLIMGSHVISATYGGNSTYAGSSSTTVTQIVGLNSSTLNLTSSPNPSTNGQTVTFTATVSPTAASGTITFTEGATVLGTASLVSGSAVYTTSSLIVGSHVISATYGGDSTYAASSSNPVTQVATCPAEVTAITDDGTGTTCGTLSYALAQPITGSSPVTITFALTQGNTITFTGSLTTTAKVKAGVTIYGGAFGSTNRIILNGNGVAGDGLHLAGNNYLVNLTIKKFGGKELTLEGTGNRMQGVVVDAS